jgi:peptidoglycan/LPS O-acetylase OafA/YrhL
VQSQSSSHRIDVVNALRAFAAIFVAWGHFAGSHGKYLAISGRYGYLGVDVFFVISGFVIPWSLSRSRYRLRDYPRFLLKRNLRLYPPYLASIALTILAIHFILAPLQHQPGVAITGRDLLLHFTYMNDILGVPWINVVYWTLAIEFQWYLLIGLIFPWLATPSPVPRFASLGALMLVYFATVSREHLVFHSIPVFLIGVFVFQYRAQLIELRQMFGLIAVMVLAMAGPIGWIVAGVATATGVLIALSTFHSPVLDRLGGLSYSLYLLHLPIGLSLIGWLSSRLPYSGSYMGVLDALGLAASLAAAWLMYQLIEKPSQEWSSAVRFVHHERERTRGAMTKTIPAVTGE